jgi:stage V sporulation protein G
VEITKVRIRPAEDRNTGFMAFADVIFDDCFAVHGMKIISGSNGLFVAMPSKENHNRNSKQRFLDICHPLTNEYRLYIENTILDSYEKEMEKNTDDAQ